MSIESTRATMMRYFSAEHNDVSMLADDVVFTMMATGEENRGPAAVLAMLDYFYHIAFEASVEKRTVLFGEDNAMIEGTVVGKHIGEFAGIPATGKEVSVPICVVYDVENEQVKRARVYLEMPVLMRQLGMQPDA